MKKIILVLTIPLAGTLSAFGQFNYFVSGATNTAGVYTDLGTDGTVISTADFDNASSAPVNIGFTFNYNGRSYTQFVLNTNGFIKLGSSGPSVDSLFGTPISIATSGALASSDPADTDLIAAFNHDLTAGTATPEYRVFTSGAPGSQVCTIQYKNVADKTTNPAVQFANIDFQIKLYEGMGTIEFIYGTFAASANGPAFKAAGIGLKGQSNAEILRGTKGSTQAWSVTTFNTVLTGNAHNFRNSNLPDPGRTYRFVPAVPNDAKVSSVYTLGNLPKGYGTPHAVQAVIRNNGTDALTNVVVTLNVTGANTFTDVQSVSLAPGAFQVVTFSAYSPANSGVNTVTVSVPSDGNSSNNSLSYIQNVNSDKFGYADASPLSATPFGFLTFEGLILCKYKANGAAYVTNVNVFLSGGSTSGKNVYAVVLDSNGVRLGTSDTSYIVADIDTGAYKSFVIPNKPDVSNSSFYVGLVQKAGSAGYRPVGRQPEADTLRSNAFYIRTNLYSGAVRELKTSGRFMIEAMVSNLPPVGISESIPVPHAFTLYPNPARDQLNIRFNSSTKNVSAAIFDLSGKMLKSVRINPSTELSVISIADLKSGTYLIEVADGENIQVGRFTKE